MSNTVVDVWGPVAPGARTSFPAAPDAHEEWTLAGGTAWVYYSPLNRRQLVRPVILSDGFSAGSSKLDQLWHGLEENGDFRFISELHAAGRDVIILGYNDRTASITDNADTVIDCIRRALNERVGRSKLVVGGFSMGGLVTRYALAKMEQDPSLPDHETSLYFSYDTPHQGAWFPVALQAFTHFATDKFGDTGAGPVLRPFSDLLNSTAAKQMARWHIEKVGGTPAQAPEREAFLQALEEVGGWPRSVRRIGVANGVDSGTGNGIKADATAVRCDGESLKDTWLKTQAQGDQIVARLQKAGEEPVSASTSGLPDIDGAPGGLFVVPTPDGAGQIGSFELAAGLMGLLGNVVDPDVIGTSCFIPSLSAVAAGDISDPKALYQPITRDESDLDAFLCAGRNEGHTTMTEELGAWIVNEIVASD